MLSSSSCPLSSGIISYRCKWIRRCPECNIRFRAVLEKDSGCYTLESALDADTHDHRIDVSKRLPLVVKLECDAVRAQSTKGRCGPKTMHRLVTANLAKLSDDAFPTNRNALAEVSHLSFRELALHLPFRIHEQFPAG